MSCGMSKGSGTGFGQFMVNQGPKYDNAMRRRKRKHSGNQVMGKAGIIRPDRRNKAKYL